MQTLFRRVLNTVGAYIAFAPIVYFILSVFMASFYKAAMAFGIILVISHMLQTKIYAKKTKRTGKAVVVTGCDSGFGNKTARELAQSGMVVFAGCLNADKARPDLQFDSDSGDNKHAGGAIIPIQMDVTKDDEVNKAVEIVDKHLADKNLTLWAVVNNAGLGLSCEAELSSMESTYRLFEVNFFGLVRVAKAFIPLLRRKKGTRIVNISSILAYLGLPNSSVYSASKAAIFHWSESLRIEMLKFDIQVCTICPDFYATPMTSTSVMVQGFDAELAKVPESIKSAYGDAYLENARKVVANKDNIVLTSPDTTPVIDTIVDCVVSYRPSPVSLPLSLTSHIVKAAMLCPLMPQIISDWILMTLSEQDRISVAWTADEAEETSD